jgi:hypothetical protein
MLARTQTIQNDIGESLHLCLVPVFNEITANVSPLNMANMLYQPEEISFCS